MLRLTLSACPHCINGVLWIKPAQPAPRPAGDEVQDALAWGGAAPHCPSHSVTSTVWNPHAAGPGFGITARQPITLGKSWWFQRGNSKGKLPVLKSPFAHFVGCFHRSLSRFWALPAARGISLPLSQMLHLCSNSCSCATLPARQRVPQDTWQTSLLQITSGSALRLELCIDSASSDSQKQIQNYHYANWKPPDLN